MKAADSPTREGVAVADYPDAISRSLPKASSGVREPHRVAIIQDWGVGLQPLYDQYDATQLAFDEAHRVRACWTVPSS